MIPLTIESSDTDEYGPLALDLYALYSMMFEDLFDILEESKDSTPEEAIRKIEEALS